MDYQCFAGTEPQEVGTDRTAIADKPEVVRSVYFDQDEILRGIMKLHSPEGFDCDMTYGNGQFWKNLPQPRLRFDIDPQVVGVQQACSRMLPVEAQSLRSVVFDPPFLTYVRAGREGNGSMVMAKRFAGYWRYDELEGHYRETISEAYRVLKPGGVLVFKCQDIIHNHKMHCTHANVIFWAETEGFRLVDLFVLPAKHRLPSPNRAGTQKHARIFHSYFLVLERGGEKPSNAIRTPDGVQSGD
jgi:hypothetical protein